LEASEFRFPRTEKFAPPIVSGLSQNDQEYDVVIRKAASDAVRYCDDPLSKSAPLPYNPAE
jgi:hypothetical protein